MLMLGVHEELTMSQALTHCGTLIATTVKIIRRRIVFHGCIDGYSRLVLYVYQCDNNNRSDTVFDAFVAATQQYGLPSRVRSDNGGENVRVCEYMVTRRGTGRHSHIAGKSTYT